MGEDFGQMFEESLQSVKPGEIVRGRVVKVGPEFVTVDIGYKSEGHIPVSEFRLRDGRIAVHVHQVVRDLEGNIISDGMVDHVYRIEDGLIKSMEIREV